MPDRKQWPPRIYAHKKSGQDRVRIDGRDIYLGKSGSEEARAAYARLVADVAAGRPVGPQVSVPTDSLTVADIVAEWWSAQSGRYSARGREANNFRDALKPLLRLYGPTPAIDFRADELEVLRLAMATGSWLTAEEVAKGRRNRAGWYASTCNRHCGRIKTVWRWAERKGLVPEGRWANLCALPGLASNDASVRHSKGRQACTLEELALVVACCPRPVAAMLWLQWHTGMRSGEVRIMRLADIDRTGEVWLYRPQVHKNDWRGQERVVLLGPAAQAILMPFALEAQQTGASGQEYLFRPTTRNASDHYSASSYSQAVRRAALDAGVPGLHPYQCRHAAKKRIAREHGLEAARAILGQRSIQTTAKYSSEADLTLAREAAKKSG